MPPQGSNQPNPFTRTKLGQKIQLLQQVSGMPKKGGGGW